MSAMPPDIEQYVAHQISIGKYPSRAALEIDAIRLHREMEQRQARLKADVQAAIDEIEQGVEEPFDIEEIKRDLRAC
jgi:Arc/MetJ-type ribon-helix-helix transcriptional regulator